MRTLPTRRAAVGSKIDLYCLGGMEDYSTIWPRVHGLRIHTRKSLAASRSPRPVVLVHGLGASTDYMLPTLARLAADFEVWAPELPGSGKSDKPRQVLNIQQLADTLAEWARVVGIPSAVFLGNSLGCQVIVDLAVRYPSLVDAAVLVGPTVDSRGHTMTRQMLRGLRDLIHEPWSLWRILARDYLRTGTRRMYRTFRFALADDILRKCPNIRAATLIVRGGYDPIAPARWIEELARLIPNAEVAEISHGTHASNYTVPDELARVAREFIHRQQ
jgi:2-hydroxy-6-oxonona-2,4-dienedioate hydrolase